MTPEQYRAYLIEIARRDRASHRPNIIDHPDNFPQQVAFLKDESTLKASFCTRRSAKSYTGGLELVDGALDFDGGNCLFIGLTRLSAKGIIWKDVLRDIDRKHNLGASFNQTELTMTLPNESVIYVTGADADEEEMNKLLGRKYRRIVIDESSMYTINVKNLVYGVLGPAVTDPDHKGRRGRISLMGTASDFPRGLFYDVTTGVEQGWSVHEWTAHDNPHVAKQWQEILDEIKEKRPLYMETPQFKQWYLNKWVVDEEKLVYRFNPERNLVKALPLGLPDDGWSVVLGVDLGWEDDNAFVLTAYHVNDPNLYVLKTAAKKKLTFDQVADKIQEFMRDREWAPNKVVIDGANKQGVESMRQRSNIPFDYADKQDKATFIELCNADLVQGKVKMVDADVNRPLWQEMAALVWVTDGDRIKLPKKEHPALPNHRTDAFLYAWRNGYHYHSAPQETKLITGSKAWYEKQAEDIWEKERERLVAEQQQGDWLTEADGW